MNKKILVCYLFTSFDNKQSFINFLKYYKINAAGANHTLLICFKLLNKKKILFFRNKLKSIKYIEFIDPVLFNDFDFGSYKRVSERYRSYTIFFLLSNLKHINKVWLAPAALIL